MPNKLASDTHFDNLIVWLDVFSNNCVIQIKIFEFFNNDLQALSVIYFKKNRVLLLCKHKKGVNTRLTFLNHQSFQI